MKKINFNGLLKSFGRTLAEHSPEILTGMGIAGMTTAFILAVRATPKALILIDEEKKRISARNIQDAEENGYIIDISNVKLSAIDTVKVTWKCYIPTVLTVAASTACLIGANSVNSKRNAALAAAYTLTENTLKEYQEKVVETIGEKKEQAIRESVAKDNVEKHPVTEKEIIITDKGSTLCYDVPSDRYFKSDIEKIKRAVNELNRTMLCDMYVSLNDFYDELGLGRVDQGDDLGWNVDRGFIELDFSSHLASDGTPCLAIKYLVAPRYGYNKFL